MNYEAQEKNRTPLWQVITAAPHRTMFLAGAVQLVTTLVFWILELTGRYSDLWPPLNLTINTTFTHLFLMIYSIFPFFTFGFLMTTYPKWMEGESVPRKSYIMSFLLQFTGILFFYLGLFLSSWILLAGIVIHISGWASGYSALLTVYRAAKNTRRYHETHLNAAIAFGIAGELSYLIFLATDRDILFQLSLRTGFWLYIIPLLIIVAHRMVPFFSSRIIEAYRIIRPPWSLPLLWAGLIGHICLDISGQKSFLFLFDIPLLLLGLYHTVIWGFMASFRERLLAVLHVSFLWFSIGMALYSMQSLWLFMSGELILAKGPLHAMAIGFLTSMVVAMGTRVSLGHSGRPLQMDDFSWHCFWGIQAAAVIRILAEIEYLETLSPVNLNIIASVIWLSSIIPWALRYGAINLRPRIDGQPG